MGSELYCGDAIEVLATLPAQSVRCCVTSPPYFGLRDYGVPGQLGLEATPDEYVSKMVEVFREVRRVLADDGTLWLNLGDSYASTGGERSYGSSDNGTGRGPGARRHDVPSSGLKPKDMVGIPWRVAFALQADGWWLRSDIIWSKPNPMPESVTDRPTKSHEYLFLLSKSQRYYYDADAIKTEARWPVGPNGAGKSPHSQGFAKARGYKPKRDKQRGHGRRHAGFNDRWDKMSKAEQQALGANARTVWEIATKPYPEAHFATFPPELASRCVKAGSAPGDTVLDLFGGSGTTSAVATGLGRSSIYVDLNPDYLDLAEHRVGPMLCARATA